jgi:hypothetical protein
MSDPWKAPNEVTNLLEIVKEMHHSKRLADASIVCCFDDSKPFVQNKLNLGKITKFNSLAKLWQKEQHDFCVSIPMDLWGSVLKEKEKEAYLDLQLTRCSAEYLPEVIEENGKKIKVKDNWGRIQYTQEYKIDDNGKIKWKILPLDLEIFAENIRRYGLWSDSLLELQSAITDSQTGAIDES